MLLVVYRSPLLFTVIDDMRPPWWFYGTERAGTSSVGLDLLLHLLPVHATMPNDLWKSFDRGLDHGLISFDPNGTYEQCRSDDFEGLSGVGRV